MIAENQNSVVTPEKAFPGVSLSVTVSPAEKLRRATEKREETVARPRWQQGWLLQRGKRKVVWVGRYREDVIAEDGTRRRRIRSFVLGSVREVSKRQAQRKLSELLAAINQGTHKPEVMITFERFVLERFEPNILPMLRFSTRRLYRHLNRRHLLPFFGKMRISEIGPADVQVFLTRVSKRVSPRTVISLRNRLSKILGTAVLWGCISRNPVKGAHVPALSDVKQRQTLTPAQFWTLSKELSEPYQTMVLLAVLSGMRCGEIYGLRWRYVDFEDEVVVVAETVYQGHSSQPKTRASNRKVFVGPLVMQALARLKPQGSAPDDFVFPSDNRTPLSPNNVRNRVLVPACKRAGIPVVGWHTFRYTYSTWANPSGESIKALQNQLGHVDSRLTLGVYVQPIPEAQRQIAAKVQGVLLPIAPKSTAPGNGSERVIH
jgi:integrase